MEFDAKTANTEPRVDDSQCLPLRPFPDGSRAKVLEQARNRLILLLPNGPSRQSQGYLLYLVAMTGSFIGGLVLFTSLAGLNRGAIVALCLLFGLLIAANAALPLRMWLRLRFLERWILVEPTQIAVKLTMFGRSKLRTYVVGPGTVAILVKSWLQDRDRKQKDFNVAIICEGKKIVFGDLLSLDEKQWIVDEINRILRGDEPKLRAVTIRENKFEFVPDAISGPSEPNGFSVQITQTGGRVEIKVRARPVRFMRRVGWVIMLVLSTLGALCVITNLLMRWWPSGAALPLLLAFTAVLIFITAGMWWGSVAVLFVETEIMVEAERMTRRRKPAWFGREKSLPTASLREIVIRSPTDPRGFKEGKPYWFVAGRIADCIVRGQSGSIQLSLMHESRELLSMGGLVRWQLEQLGVVIADKPAEICPEEVEA
jgi:hypothetical protein